MREGERKKTGCVERHTFPRIGVKLGRDFQIQSGEGTHLRIYDRPVTLSIILLRAESLLGICMQGELFF